MLMRLPPAPRGVLILAVIAASTLWHGSVLLLAAGLKALAPRSARRDWNARLAGIAEAWIGVNSALIRRGTRTRFDVDLPPGLEREGSYLVLANHRSWVDIPVLQHVFNRRIPLLRFFLKQELIWVPVLGVAWWALDFPFMKRKSRARDLAATRRACEKFREIPVAVMNFVEGTRFTPAKHAEAPMHRHLLRPKAGGVAFVLEAMGDALRGVLDVTVAYPAGTPSVWDLVFDRLPQVQVHVRELALPVGLGAYESDPAARERFQEWINALWREKDARLATMLEDRRGSSTGSP